MVKESVVISKDKGLQPLPEEHRLHCVDSFLWENQIDSAFPMHEKTVCAKTGEGAKSPLVSQ